MTDEQRKTLDELHSKICDSIIRQARVWSSTLAIEAIFEARSEESQAAWQLLRSMIEELSDLSKRAAVMLDENAFAAQQLANWLGEIAHARMKHEDPLPIIDKLIAEHVKIIPPTNPNVH